jgi:hypothetical protein
LEWALEEGASDEQFTEGWMAFSRMAGRQPSSSKKKGGHGGDGVVVAFGDDFVEHELTPDEREDQDFRRAVGAITKGDVGQAAKALERAAPAPLNDTTKSKLSDLHPQQLEENVVEVGAGALEAAKGRVPQLTATQLLSYLRSRPKLSAGGPSGWRFMHLKAFTKGNDRGVNLLVKVVNRIVRGELPEEVRDDLMRARLVALLKPDNGIRPIAIAEVLYRLASGMLCCAIAAQLAAALGPKQFGAPGRKGGSEAMVLGIATCLAQHPEWVLLAIDLVNAFNKVLRKAILEGAAGVQPLLPLAYLAYGKSSVLVLADGSTITSAEGTKQGHPDGPSCFNLAQSLALAVAALHIATSGYEVLIASFFDDSNIIGPLDQVLDTWSTLQGALANIGLQPNQRKFKLYTPTENPEARAAADANHWTYSNTGITILGCPVGDEAFVEDQVNKLVDDTVKWVQKVVRLALVTTSADQKLPRRQAAYHLLRMCGPSKLNHLWRSVPPERARSGASRMDVAFEKAIFDLGDIPAAERSVELRTLVHLPVKYGGLGITSCVDTLNAAYVGAWALVGHQVQILAGPNCLQEGQAGLHHIVEALGAVADHFNPGGGGGLQGLCAEPRAGIQSVIAGRIQETKARDLVEGWHAHKKTLFNSQKGTNGGLWLLSLPTSSFTTLSDAEFEIAIQQRLLFIPQADRDFIQCPLCGVAVMDHNHHALSCQSTRGRVDRFARHTAIVSAVGTAINRAGLRAQYEKQVSSFCPLRPNMADLKADIVFRNHSGDDVLVEITVAHALLSGQAETERAAGHAAAKAEHEKRTKYNHHHDMQATTLHVVALETQGHMGEGTIKLIQELEIRMQSVEAREGFRRYAFSALACSLRKLAAQQVIKWRSEFARYSMAASLQLED